MSWVEELHALQFFIFVVIFVFSFVRMVEQHFGSSECFRLKSFELSPLLFVVAGPRARAL